MEEVPDAARAHPYMDAVLSARRYCHAVSCPKRLATRARARFPARQAAQDYLTAAVQRNRIDDELRHVKRFELTQRCTLGGNSAYESHVVSIEKERAAKAARAMAKGGAIDFSPAWCVSPRP